MFIHNLDYCKAYTALIYIYIYMCVRMLKYKKRQKNLHGIKFVIVEDILRTRKQNFKFKKTIQSFTIDTEHT